MIHRFHWSKRGGKLAAALAGLVLLGAAGAAQAQTTTEPAPLQEGTSAGNLVELNDAIRMYLTGDREAAKTLLLALREKDPQNAACLYYLALIYLEDGLNAPDRDAARAAYEEARRCMEEVIRFADRRVIPVRAAVDLSIAQLASENPVEKEKALDLARKAAETLSAYVATSEGQKDPNGFFFLGIAQYRLGPNHFAASSRSFEEAEKLARQEPEMSETDRADFETNILYYRALIDLRSQRFLPGKEKMQEVLKRTEGPLAENAQKLIAEVDQRMKGESLQVPSPFGALRFEGFITLSNAYDDNVILLGQDTRLPRGIVRNEDYTFGVEAGFDLSRNFSKQQKELSVGENLTIGIGGRTFHEWHPSIGEFDINEYQGRAYVSWEFVKDLILGLQYDYTYTQLGHDPFISSNRLTPFLVKQWRSQGAGEGEGEVRAESSLFYSFDYRDYLDLLTDPRFDRDGKYHAISLRQSFNLWKARELWPNYYTAESKDGKDGNRWFTAVVGYTYRNERTQGDEFDLFGNGVYGGLEIPLPWRLTADLGADFTWDDYSHRSLLDYEGKERFDFIQRYGFGLTRTLVERGEYKAMPTLRVRVRGGVDLTFQDSNVWNRLGEDVYSFNRAIYSLKLMINF